MTTLDYTPIAPRYYYCEEHTPHTEAISEHNESEYTFCEVCELDITRYWIDSDGDRLGMWSSWNEVK
jgi:hypothetical protein